MINDIIYHRKSFLIIVFVGLIAAFSAYGSTDDKHSFTHHSQIIDDHLKAYQAKDLNKFASYFSDNIEFFSSKYGKVNKGKKVLKETFKKLFDKVDEVKPTILRREFINGMVVDIEKVTIRTGKKVDSPPTRYRRLQDTGWQNQPDVVTTIKETIFVASFFNC